MLSIYVATYNHEKYIARALKSIMMQKTTYKYEVWVGEDCSTDGTRQILKKIERNLPDSFHIIYREHNMHQEKIRNGDDLKKRCKGKYIIALEGDDFWTDENKIEKQINFLEKNPEYIAVAHDCVVVDKHSKITDEEYPSCKEEIYTFRHLASEILPGQLTTVMYRREFLNNPANALILNSGVQPGDRAIYFGLLCNGKIYCMQEKMSAYRHITQEGASWSANYMYRYANWKLFYKTLLDYSKSIKHKEAERFAKFFYLKNQLKGLKEKQNTFKEVVFNCSVNRIGVTSVVIYLKYRVRKDLFNKKFWV